MRTWVMIPARGGSVGVPRKNVRMLAGQPLIARVVGIVLKVVPANQVVVITDDDEIAGHAAAAGARVVREPRTTGKATLDDVALKVVAELEALGATAGDAFVTVQPTCPFIRPERITQAVAALQSGAGSALTVVDDRHLTWRDGADGRPEPEYTARVNRQLLPSRWRETGGVIATTIGAFTGSRTRINQPIELIKVESEEALDIDTFADWKIAEYLVSRRRVLIRCDAAVELGMGHVYRAAALAQELAEHELSIVISSDKPLSSDFFNTQPFHVIQVDNDSEFIDLVARENADLVILDQLDTDADYVRALQATGARVVTFEDLGSGAEVADLLVSDLYANPAVPNERQLNGVANAVLSPAFNDTVEPVEVKPAVQTVLVVFGGTDPSRLTVKTLIALGRIGFKGEVLVVRGLGAAEVPPLNEFGLSGEVLFNVRHMPSLMQRADLAVSSAGRTITELLTLGLPVVCMAQNYKETTHTHAGPEVGVRNLGLGSEVEDEVLQEALRELIDSEEEREHAHNRALAATAGRSNASVIRRIIDAAG